MPSCCILSSSVPAMLIAPSICALHASVNLMQSSRSEITSLPPPIDVGGGVGMDVRWVGGVGRG
jgi:hypothetical protein